MRTAPVHQHLETPTETDTHGTCSSETSEGRQWATAASDWNVISNQHNFIDEAIDCFNACLKANNKHWTFAMIFLRNCHGILSVRYCCYEQIDLCFISQGRVRTSVRSGGQFCCIFVANLLRYLCAKNYGNIVRFDKVIAKIKRVHFLPHSIVRRY